MKITKNLAIFSSLLALSFALILWISINTTNNINLHPANIKSFNDGWTYTKDNENTLISLPTRIISDDTLEFTISNRIPNEFLPDEILCIRTSQQSIKVEINNKVVYEFAQNGEVFFSKSGGSRWNFISIPASSSGQTIRITLSTPYKLYSGYVNSILYGKESSILYYLFFKYSLSLICAAIVCIFGIVGMCFYNISGIKRHRSPQLMYISLFSICISLWLFSESKLLQFIIGNQTLIENIGFIGFLLFPIPLFSYIECSYASSRKKIFTYIIGYLQLYCFASILLQLFHIFDLFETIHISLIGLLICIIITLLVLFRELIIYKNNDVKRILFPLFVLVFFGLLEIIHYFYSTDIDSSTIFLIGLIVYITLYGLNSLRSIRSTFRRAKETKYYQKLAFQDILTGANNRTAYLKKIEDTYNTPEKLKNLRLVIFDLNNLKYINDNFGHIIGDEALKEAFLCIKETFGRYGTCYRIGGDEFTCIIPKISEKNFTNACNQFLSLVKKSNSETIYPFNVAFGDSIFDETKDAKFNDLSARVDHLMYINKHEIKISELQP